MNAVVLLNRRGEYVFALIDGRVQPRKPKLIVWNRIHEDDRDRVEQIVMRSILKGTQAKYRARRFDGQVWEIHLHPVRAKGVAVLATCWRIDEGVSRLTPRQRDVCRHVGHGYTAAEIAARIDCSVSSVETHKARARELLGLERREFLLWCVDHRQQL